jgi:hypothetical protein
MRLARAASLTVIALAAAGLAAAQPPAPEPRVRGSVRLAGLYFDNFFQATTGLPEEHVFGASLEGRIDARLSNSGRWWGFLEGDYIRYDSGFDPSRGIGGGLRWDARPHRLDVAARYLAGRPSREVGDEFDRADVFSLDGEYAYRLNDDVELIGLAELRHESYALSPDKANDILSGGAAVRYRGFGRIFSPELGLRRGGRDVVSDNEDYDQREIYLRVRSAPSEKLYLSVRLRHRKREYSVADSGASNFGREDIRKQLAVGADWRQNDTVQWNLYYTLEDSASSRPTGDFATSMLSLGVTFRF